MASAPVLPSISVEVYERTPALFERHEYVDGILIEKPLPTWKHSQLQIWLGALLLQHYSWLDVGSELHSKLRQNTWRIPDLAVQNREIARKEQYAFTPLLLAIEIRSPEDKWSELLAKFEDYHVWGVPYCWLFDPETERVWTYHQNSDLEEVAGKDYIQAGEIQLSILQIFSRFHEK